MARYQRSAIALLCLLGIAFFVLADALHRDALIFALYEPDPNTGRTGGCYTLLDFALGHQSPHGWTRSAERAGSWVAGSASAASAFGAIRRLFVFLRPHQN